MLDESFPFLPVGWQADWIGDEFILRPGPMGSPSQQAGEELHGGQSPRCAMGHLVGFTRK